MMRFSNYGPTTALAAILLVTSAAAAEPEQGFTPIFNGKDLAGWEGKPGYWSVEDGCLTGATSAERPLASSTYLFWRGGRPANFELRTTYRLVGSFGNSGINFRTQELPNLDVKGYQGDMETGSTYTGVLFDVKRQLPGEPWDRQILAKQGQKVVIAEDGRRAVTTLSPAKDVQKLVKANDWNEYAIIAQGAEIVIKVNGAVFSHVIDRQTGKASHEGLIALQLHRGPPMKVQYKSIRIKTLP